MTPNAPDIAAPAPTAVASAEADIPTPERPKEPPLLAPAFLGKLKQLNVISKKVFRGQLKGERRSLKRGQSVEFADFRNYVFGDDPRFIDWNTYARLERLYLKLFMEEEDLHVYLLVDCSASMAGGSPDPAAAATKGNGAGEKFRFARALAAALSYISALNQDHVAIGGYRGGLTDVMRPKRGKGQAPKIIEFLEGLRSGGQTSLTEAAKRFLLENRRPGLVVVISDFLDPAGYEEGLKMLQARRFDVFVAHVLSPEELDPALRGDVRLIDAETGAATEVSISPRVLDAYKKAVAGFCQGLNDYCLRRGMGYLMARTDADLEDLVLKYFRRAGLVR